LISEHSMFMMVLSQHHLARRE